MSRTAGPPASPTSWLDPTLEQAEASEAGLLGGRLGPVCDLGTPPGGHGQAALLTAE